MSLYVRSLTDGEQCKLKSIVRKEKDPSFARRAQVILASHKRTRVREIVRVVGYSYDHVRAIIHLFNKGGIRSIKPLHVGGRPPIFNEQQRKVIVELAESHPKDLGYPLSQWSLSQLQLVLVKDKKFKYISRPTIRTILKNAGLSHQRTKTWKRSTDPKYKKND